MLLRELIHIPDQIYANEFVIKLTEGIEHAEETLGQYVVTEQLRAQYSKALAMIANSVQSGKSQAAFLHGSFGSGKSHFMAVLNLLLSGNSTAWTHPELASVTVQHSSLRDKKLLLLAFHMIGQTSMESAILGGYVRQVAQLHPDAPVAPLYRGEKLFDDARHLINKMGEEPFFAGLGGGETAKTALGRRASSGGWTRERFDQAAAAEPGSPERGRLISALLGSYFPSYSEVQSDRTESFLPFDQGLSAMSCHAKSLGYDGIVLFLDELILWLANMSSNLSFVHGEIQKLVKLVEAQNSNRPTPIVSIVARQRDLKDLIGESLSGYEQFNFHDQIKHFEKRFDTINLEDTNLPEIIARRILKPRTDEARTQLQDQFDRLKLKDNVRDTLALNYDLDDCRKVYPFSPALIDTLVAVSSLLQRNRTAIRILMELLVARRDELEVGQLIPVGDLFDLVSGSTEPYDDSMRRAFESAKRLLRDRFEPLLMDSNGQPTATAPNDLRLIKTILLSALVPNVPAFSKLTATKLSALNHGTIKSPIPGRESSAVQAKLDNWRASVGELRIHDDTKEITLNLTTVDLDKILENARTHDNVGNRKAFLRQTLFRMLKLDQDQQPGMLLTTRVLWRGTWREFEIQYLNVRERTNLSDFQAGAYPRVILDFPFDPDGHPSDDLRKLEAYSEQQEDTRTVVWLPHFLSPQTLKELGRLLMIDYTLKGDRIDSALSHLAQTDRPAAKSMLENQRSALTKRLEIAMEMAYGIRNREAGILDESDGNQLPADRQLVSLHRSFQPRMPVVTNLESALKELLKQELEAHYPGHPLFVSDTEISNDTIRKVWAEVYRTCRAPQQRQEIEKGLRERVRSVVEPLQLAKMGETHLNLSDHWQSKFEKDMSRHNLSGTVRVGDLRKWMDEPKPMGLPNRISSLVIYTFAEQTQREMFRQNLPIRDFDSELPNDVELRLAKLPDNPVWLKALERVKMLVPSLHEMALTSANLSALAQEFKGALVGLQAVLKELPEQLLQLCRTVGFEPENSPRLHHARQAAALIALLADNDPLSLVDRLAKADWSERPQDLVATIQQAKQLEPQLQADRTAVLALIRDDAELMEMLSQALSVGEFEKQLLPVLKLCHKNALERISAVPPVTVAAHSPPVVEAVRLSPVGEISLQPMGTTKPRRSIHSLQHAQLTAPEARQRLQELLELLGDDRYQVRLDIEVWSEES